MPRIDAMSGCAVMTTAEFLNAEAEREGKGRTGGDILADIYQDIDRENMTEEARLRDPQTLLPLLQHFALEGAQDWLHDLPIYPSLASSVKYLDGKCYQALEDYGPPPARPPFPMEVREILDAHYKGGFRGTEVEVEARVLCEDGVERPVRYYLSEDSGDRMNPPDRDEGILWL